ncbi:MAG: M23 family metallopeptidase [Vicinamibacteria bacterium]|nr:M23 family metallopeptidase [Vicinamibacteria bacterium]
MSRHFDLSTCSGAFRLGLLLGAGLSAALFSFVLWRSKRDTFRTGPPSKPTVTQSAGLLLFPVSGGSRSGIESGFRELRGDRRHEAVDIFADRGTPVLAVSDGSLARLSNSRQGGKGLYQRSATGEFCYYYAHFDRYADGLEQGRLLARGQIVGYVGSTGNASVNAPHLHFAVFRLAAGQRCAEGKPVDPFPLFEPMEE